jgi:polyisoprenoid-binding protein YceI
VGRRWRPRVRPLLDHPLRHRAQLRPLRHHRRQLRRRDLKGLTIEIDAASINTGNKKRDDHLKGPDFFNVKQFPKLTFKSTKVEKKGDAYSVTGDLTIHGVTKSVTVDVKKTGMGKDPWGNERIGFTTNFTIKRSDYGITHMANGLSDEVQLMLSAEAIKGK